MYHYLILFFIFIVDFVVYNIILRALHEVRECAAAKEVNLSRPICLYYNSVILIVFPIILFIIIMTIIIIFMLLYLYVAKYTKTIILGLKGILEEINSYYEFIVAPANELVQNKFV